MNDRMQTGTVEATRLTREGRLVEATALLQRTLGGGSAPPETPEEQIETPRRAVNETAQTTAPSRSGPTGHGLRLAPRPSRRFRGLPRMPGAAPGGRCRGACLHPRHLR